MHAQYAPDFRRPDANHFADSASERVYRPEGLLYVWVGALQDNEVAIVNIIAPLQSIPRDLRERPDDYGSSPFGVRDAWMMLMRRWRVVNTFVAPVTVICSCNTGFTNG